MREREDGGGGGGRGSIVLGVRGALQFLTMAVDIRRPCTRTHVDVLSSRYVIGYVVAMAISSVSGKFEGEVEHGATARRLANRFTEERKEWVSHGRWKESVLSRVYRVTPDTVRVYTVV